MFTRDTLITMGDGQPHPIGPMTEMGDATFLTMTKDGPAELLLSTIAGEYIEVTTTTGRKLQCAPRVRLALAGGGYTYACEAGSLPVDTESGPEAIASVNVTGKHDNLVSVRLTRVHAVLANGFWVLVD